MAHWGERVSGSNNEVVMGVIRLVSRASGRPGRLRARAAGVVVVPGCTGAGIAAGRVRRAATVLLVGLAVSAGCGSVAAAADAQIYWTSVRTIMEANLDGTHVNHSFITTHGGFAGLAVSGQHIYWTTYATIGQANLDGTDVNQSLITGAKYPYGVAVEGQHIYWTNALTDTLGEANLDGTDVNQSFITGANDPYGVAVEGQHIYWTNTNGDTIGEANLDGSDVNQTFITGAHVPHGLAVDSQHIYWTNTNGDTIGEANLDGSDVNQTFITGGSPVGVALDSQHIYWTNYGNGDGMDSTIGRADLDGTDVNQSFITSANAGADGPLGVAVSPGSVSGPGSGTAAVARAHVFGTTASVKVTCTGAAGATCKIGLTLSVTETLKGGKVIAVSASMKRTTKVVVLGTARLTLTAGQGKTVSITLNTIGQRLLATRHTLKAKLTANAADRTISTKTITYTKPSGRLEDRFPSTAMQLCRGCSRHDGAPGPLEEYLSSGVAAGDRGARRGPLAGLCRRACRSRAGVGVGI